jgi:hypothetical protein
VRADFPQIQRSPAKFQKFLNSPMDSVLRVTLERPVPPERPVLRSEPQEAMTDNPRPDNPPDGKPTGR